MNPFSAEWQAHRAVWLAWPYDPEVWGSELEDAQTEFKALIRAIAEDPQSEKICLLVPDEDSENALRAEWKDLPIRYVPMAYGDIWLRDTAPLFFGEEAKAFRFNGWGGKYIFEGDEDLAERIAARAGKSFWRSRLVAEGGAFEWDGEGTCLTTRQCLIDERRNPAWSEADVESEMSQHFGVQKMIWLSGSLLNDHTDGHIDTLARFAAPAKVLLMRATDPSDPNAKILEELAKQVESQTDAQGRAFEIQFVPSPGKILDSSGEILPASYLNFYISNSQVLVPIYGSPHDEDAVKSIAKAFPDRKVRGLMARAILTGGGAFHCISQQEV